MNITEGTYLGYDKLTNTALLINNIGNNNAGELLILTENSKSKDIHMIIKHTGNVGIGTLNPEELLHVNNNIKSDGFFIGDGSKLTNLNIDHISNGKLNVSYGGTGVDFISQGQVLIGNNTNSIITSNNLFWDHLNSRLGICTSLPEKSLHVKGDTFIDGDLIIKGTTTITNINTTTADQIIIINEGNGPALLVNQYNNEIIANFQNNGNSILKIDNNGIDISGNVYVNKNIITNNIITNSITLNNNYTWKILPINLYFIKTIKSPNLKLFKKNNNSIGVYSYFFSSCMENEITFNIQIPYDYLIGTPIVPCIHWCPTTSDNGNIVWGFEYTYSCYNDTFVDTIINKDYFSTDSTSYKYKISNLQPIYINNNNPSILICRLFRDALNELDSYPNEIVFLSIDIHYKTSLL